jgi:hypothetical protein
MGTMKPEPKESIARDADDRLKDQGDKLEHATDYPQGGKAKHPHGKEKTEPNEESVKDQGDKLEHASD